jgi:hypothetical protein
MKTKTKAKQMGISHFPCFFLPFHQFGSDDALMKDDRFLQKEQILSDEQRKLISNVVHVVDALFSSR